MDKDLQKEVNELCESLKPMNIKLEKWLLEHKKSFIENDEKPAKLGLLVGNAYAVYILIDDLLETQIK